MKLVDSGFAIWTAVNLGSIELQICFIWASGQAGFAFPADVCKVAYQPLKRACVLFAVLPPKNSDSTGAKAFSAQGFAIA
jgi:hypothetical protein